MHYLLDTDVCIEVIRQREPALSRVRGESPADLALSAMTVAELRYGSLNSSDPARNLRLLDAFLLDTLPILPFDLPAARLHAELRLATRSNPIGERDLVIAATAQANGLTVITGNERHFGTLPGVRMENWMAR